MGPIRVLIADDHPLFRDGMRMLLGSVDDIDVIGEAATGEEATTLAASLQPDVILMDVQMPGIDGIEATRRVTAASPTIGILMVTMFEDDESVFAAMRVGARGYILKNSAQAEVLRAIHAVAGGEAIFSPTIARRMIQYFAAPRPAPVSDAFPELTEREREILTLIAKGNNNAQIAERLVLSASTVRNHITNIFSKLQVADRAQAIIRARDAGLGLG
jgi:DNA-binding NarL/FixJ family response regulator